jgi:hypothetical protein
MGYAIEGWRMAVLGAKKRQNIAAILYGVALLFLAVGLAIYFLSSNVSAIALGLLSSVGIALSATGIILGKSKK